MKIRIDKLTVSSVLLTICLLSLISPNLRLASTWRERRIWVTEKFIRYNYEALLAFASLALIIIAITVIWTAYQKRFRSAWFIMLVFVCVYFVPVYLLDVILDIKRVGWPWWPGLIREAMEGRMFARDAFWSLATLMVMVIALLLPVRSFFGKGASSTSVDLPHETPQPIDRDPTSKGVHQ